MACAIKNLSDVLKGDSFPETTITLTDKLDVPLDLTGVTIRCQFRKKTKTGELAKTISIGSGILVPTPTNGEVIVSEFIVDWEADIYWYDFEFTYSPTKVITYFGGYIKVIQDVTQNN